MDDGIELSELRDFIAAPPPRLTTRTRTDAHLGVVAEVVADEHRGPLFGVATVRGGVVDAFAAEGDEVVECHHTPRGTHVTLG